MTERDTTLGSLLQSRLTRRRLLQAGLVTPFGAAVAAACQTVVPPAGTGSPGTSPTAAPASAVPTPAASQRFDGVKLLAWSGGTTAGPATEAAAGWKAATGGEVEVVTVPFAERELKFAGLIATSDASVDLLYASGQFVGRFGDRLYADLSSVDASVYVPAILPILSAQGKLRAVPQHSEMEIFIYNKTHFQEAGLDPENPPRTWAELYEAAPALNQGGHTACAVPFLTSLGTSAAYWLCFYNSIPGAKLLSDDRTEIAFDNDNGLKTWQTIEAGFKAGFFDTTLDASVDDYGTGTKFNAGETASMINFAELWGYAVGGDPENFPTTLDAEEVGAVTLPGIEPDTTGSINGFEGFGINRFSAKQDAAMSYLLYMGGPEFQRQLNLSKVLPSSRTDVLNDPEVVAEYPVGQVLAQQGQGNLDRYAAPYDWTPPFSSALALMANGEITAEEAHQQCIDRVKLIITNYLVG